MANYIPYELNLSPRKRGDTIWVYITNATDRDGNSVTLSDYTLRAVLKYVTDTADNDSSAISVVTSGAGITVSGDDATVQFPATSTDDVTPAPNTLKYEVQATKTADVTIVRTLVYGTIPIMQDDAKTSP
jgi:hypothetical protein